MGRIYRGVTLSEVTVSIAIICMIALIAVPQYGVAAVDRDAEATADIVREVQASIDAFHEARGRYPGQVEAAWFPLSKMVNPYRPEVKRTLIERGGFGEKEPLDPRLSGPAGYWYNPETGSFRAFVPDQGSPAATEKLFERVNRYAR
jgi:prepilin-type N-terminal cleavage/methylation domain-containing protein